MRTKKKRKNKEYQNITQREKVKPMIKYKTRQIKQPQIIMVAQVVHHRGRNQICYWLIIIIIKQQTIIIIIIITV